MATSTCRKRKRVVLSLENKLSILDRLAKRERATKIAIEFGIGNSTVTDIKKNESSIRSFVSTMESLSVSSKERKIMRLADDEKVDEAVYLWYVQKRSEDSSSDIPTNGEAMEMLDKCLAWYECQSDATPTSIMLPKRIRDLASKQHYAILKQLTLQSCFATCK